MKRSIIAAAVIAAVIAPSITHAASTTLSNVAVTNGTFKTPRAGYTANAGTTALWIGGECAITNGAADLTWDMFLVWQTSTGHITQNGCTAEVVAQ